MDLLSSLLEGVIPQQEEIVDTPEAPKDGSYPATAGGYQTSFVVEGKTWVAKYNCGVRGMNIPDTVTITNGIPVSRVLSAPSSSAFVEYVRS